MTEAARADGIYCGLEKDCGLGCGSQVGGLGHAISQLDGSHPTLQWKVVKRRRWVHERGTRQSHVRYIGSRSKEARLLDALGKDRQTQEDPGSGCDGRGVAVMAVAFTALFAGRWQMQFHPQGLAGDHD